MGPMPRHIAGNGAFGRVRPAARLRRRADRLASCSGSTTTRLDIGAARAVLKVPARAAPTGMAAHVQGFSSAVMRAASCAPASSRPFVASGCAVSAKDHAQTTHTPPVYASPSLQLKVVVARAVRVIRNAGAGESFRSGPNGVGGSVERIRILFVVAREVP